MGQDEKRGKAQGFVLPRADSEPPPEGPPDVYSNATVVREAPAELMAAIRQAREGGKGAPSAGPPAGPSSKAGGRGLPNVTSFVDEESSSEVTKAVNVPSERDGDSDWDIPADGTAGRRPGSPASPGSGVSPPRAGGPTSGRGGGVGAGNAVARLDDDEDTRESAITRVATMAEAALPDPRLSRGKAGSGASPGSGGSPGSPASGVSPGTTGPSSFRSAGTLSAPGSGRTPPPSGATSKSPSNQAPSSQNAQNAPNAQGGEIPSLVEEDEEQELSLNTPMPTGPGAPRPRPPPAPSKRAPAPTQPSRPPPQIAGLFPLDASSSSTGLPHAATAQAFPNVPSFAEVPSYGNAFPPPNAPNTPAYPAPLGYPAGAPMPGLDGALPDYQSAGLDVTASNRPKSRAWIVVAILGVLFIAVAAAVALFARPH